MPLVSELAEIPHRLCRRRKVPEHHRGYRQSLGRLQEVAREHGLPPSAEDYAVPRVYESFPLVKFEQQIRGGVVPL